MNVKNIMNKFIGKDKQSVIVRMRKKKAAIDKLESEINDALSNPSKMHININQKRDKVKQLKEELIKMGEEIIKDEQEGKYEEKDGKMK